VGLEADINSVIMYVMKTGHVSTNYTPTAIVDQHESLKK